MISKEILNQMNNIERHNYQRYVQLNDFEFKEIIMANARKLGYHHAYNIAKRLGWLQDD
jgi:hypothetical protein